MKSKYELVVLIISGNVERFLSLGHGNIFSNKNKVFIGSEGSNRFIITFDANTFLDIDDEEMSSIIKNTMVNIDKITNDPDPYMSILFRITNVDGFSDGVNYNIAQKFDRLEKYFGSRDLENEFKELLEESESSSIE